MLIDSWGRNITYLRISVTDRCNLRCVYCMPPGGVPWKPHEEILSYEEITQIASAAARLGIRSIRLTGGEPLVRPDLPVLIAALSAIPGIEDISLTTNGTLLEKMTLPLARAGLKRVNVSLDTLDAEKFSRITRGGKIEQALRGIAAAESAGLQPVKINSVVIRGFNSGEITALANLSYEHAWHIRFIEVMPIGNQDDWGAGFPRASDRYISMREMREMLAPLDLQPCDIQSGSGPARAYRIPGGLGTVGFISPISEHFCADCNRLRLTADGNLRSCLMSNREVNLREAIRAGRPVEDLILLAVAQKPQHHPFSESASLPIDLQSSRYMAQIGG